MSLPATADSFALFTQSPPQSLQLVDFLQLAAHNDRHNDTPVAAVPASPKTPAMPPSSPAFSTISKSSKQIRDGQQKLQTKSKTWLRKATSRVFSGSGTNRGSEKAGRPPIPAFEDMLDLPLRIGVSNDGFSEVWAKAIERSKSDPASKEDLVQSSLKLKSRSRSMTLNATLSRSIPKVGRSFDVDSIISNPTTISSSLNVATPDDAGSLVALPDFAMSVRRKPAAFLDEVQVEAEGCWSSSIIAQVDADLPSALLSKAAGQLDQAPTMQSMTSSLGLSLWSHTLDVDAQLSATPSSVLLPSP